MSTSIQFPQVPFVDKDGYVSLAWRQWLLNPQFIQIAIAQVLAVSSGGTGIGSGIPGGILGFTNAANLASSVELTKNEIVLGGGAGLTPKPLGDLGTTVKVLHGNAGGLPSFGQVVEDDLSLSDNTTDDVSITKHGFAPKAPNDSSQFLNGLGSWATPASGGSSVLAWLAL